ncbi:MAG: hypothetical protein ABEJ75_03530 [Candidatus Nanohaloarchaea archaeon]
MSAVDERVEEAVDEAMDCKNWTCDPSPVPGDVFPEDLDRRIAEAVDSGDTRELYLLDTRSSPMQRFNGSVMLGFLPEDEKIRGMVEKPFYDMTDFELEGSRYEDRLEEVQDRVLEENDWTYLARNDSLIRPYSMELAADSVKESLREAYEAVNILDEEYQDFEIQRSL